MELTETLTALRTEAIEALKHGGEYGRPYRQAMENIARIERRLEAAKEREERREREAKRDPRDIAKDVVDRQMGY